MMHGSLAEQTARFAFLVVLLFFLFFCTTPVLSSAALDQTQPNWKQQWDKTVSAAKSEGRIVVFGPAGELIRNALVGSFSKSFPNLSLEYVGGRAAEQVARLQAERDGGVFSVDVFIGGAVTMMQLGSLGALERLEPVLILPEVKEPKYWRDERLEFTNPSTRYTLVFSSQLAIFFAWVVTRTDTPLRAFIEVMLWLGFFLPLLPMTMGWILLLDPYYGLINKFLMGIFGLAEAPFDIYSYWGIIWCHLAFSISVRFLLITPAFSAMDAALEEAGLVCGSNRAGVLMRVTIPVLARPF